MCKGTSITLYTLWLWLTRSQLGPIEAEQSEVDHSFFQVEVKLETKEIMPSYRSYGSYRRKGRKYTKARTAWYNRKMSAVDMAAAAWRGVKYLKGLVNVESKLFDATASVAPDTSGFVNALSAVSAGDDVNNRSGNSIRAKHMLLRFTASRNSSVAITNLRVLVVQDESNTGSVPSVSDVLQTLSPTAAINADAVARFKPLRDELITLNGDGEQGTSRKWYIPLDFHTRYTGTGNNPYKNQIYLVTISDQGSGTAPVVSFSSRLMFYDN